MAYIVTRNKKSGYVALVEKKRVSVAGGKTSVRNVGYVCGLGVMDQGEFEEFRDWAHGITHQESRKEAVLACPKVVKKGKETKAVIAGERQKTTTVKPMRKAKTVWKPKTEVRKHYPVPALEGYKGKTHTQMMVERKKQKAVEKSMREAKADKIAELKKIGSNWDEYQTKKEAVERKLERAYKTGKLQRPKTVKRERPASKFSPEGMEFSRQSKKKLAREGVIRRR